MSSWTIIFGNPRSEFTRLSRDPNRDISRTKKRKRWHKASISNTGRQVVRMWRCGGGGHSDPPTEYKLIRNSCLLNNESECLIHTWLFRLGRWPSLGYLTILIRYIQKWPGKCMLGERFMAYNQLIYGAKSESLTSGGFFKWWDVLLISTTLNTNWPWSNLARRIVPGTWRVLSSKIYAHRTA